MQMYNNSIHYAPACMYMHAHACGNDIYKSFLLPTLAFCMVYNYNNYTLNLYTPFCAAVINVNVDVCMYVYIYNYVCT